MSGDRNGQTKTARPNRPGRNGSDRIGQTETACSGNAEWLDNTTRVRTFIPDTGPILLEWPCQGEPGSGLTASALVSGFPAPACPNGIWSLLRPVSAAQKSKPSNMLSSNVRSIDLPMDYTAWRLWMMRQLNGCSTPAPRSGAAKQRTATTRSNDEEATKIAKANLSHIISQGK